MFGDLMGKMKEQMEEMKVKLEGIEVCGEAEGGLVKVTANGNRKILNISVSDQLVGDKEAIEELVLVAVNRALEEAEKVNANEMQGVAAGMLPGMGNLGGLGL